MNNEAKILSILETLAGEMREVRQDISSLKQGQSKLEQGQSKLEKDLAETKNILIRMEQDHGKKIQAALDGYTMLYDITKQTRDDVAKLKKTQEEQELHIKVLNSKKVQ